MVQLVRPRRRNGLRRGYSVACQAVRLEGFRPVGGRLLDVSHRGALLECNGALDVGDELVLCFEAPRSRRMLDAVAKVRRVVRHDSGAQAGLELTEMDWEARSELFLRLIGVPPPVPNRRPLVDYAATVRRIAMTAPGRSTLWAG